MHDQLLRFKDLRAVVGLSRTTIWRQERAGNFPTRRRISDNAVGWLRSEIEVWIAARAPATPKVPRGIK